MNDDEEKKKKKKKNDNYNVWRKSTLQHFELGAVISSLLKTPPLALPPPLPLTDSDSAGHVGCIDGRGRGRVFRSDDITAPRSKCCEVLFRHTL